MKKIVAVVSLVAAGLLAAPAHAQFAKPEDAVKFRQSAFTLIGNHMGRINAALKATPPNTVVVQNSATLIEALSRSPFEAFTPDSDLVAGTKAKPEIWKDQAQFKKLAEAMQTDAAKLVTAAKSGDVKAMQTQFGALGQSCKACHDDYRAK